jgi:hypothetical protein
MRDRITLIDEQIYLFKLWLVLYGAAAFENLVYAAVTIIFLLLIHVPVS